MDNDIHNYYETVVFQKLAEYTNDDPTMSEELWSDIACIALNHLPPRYVRHAVDMSFYTSPQERREMDDRIERAIVNAIRFVRLHPNVEPNPTVN